MILAVAGHRPKSLGGYSALALSALNNFALTVLKQHRPDYLMIGMALGWDTACANAAVEMGIKFTAAVPFEGHGSNWSAEQRAHYSFLLDKAFDVHLVSEGGYSLDKLLRRNEFCVDQAHAVLALWNGDHAGGTAYAVRYAGRTGKPVFNAWDEWLQFSAEPRHAG